MLPGLREEVRTAEQIVDEMGIYHTLCFDLCRWRRDTRRLGISSASIEISHLSFLRSSRAERISSLYTILFRSRTSVFGM